MAVDYPIENPWPPIETISLRSSAHQGACVLIEWRDDARIYVKIGFENGGHYDLYSPVLKRPMRRCCRDRPCADIEAVCSFQDAVNAAQVQRRSS
jgi:hypothetical protein